jgi:hypothetical protein
MSFFGVHCQRTFYHGTIVDDTILGKLHCKMCGKINSTFETREEQIAEPVTSTKQSMCREASAYVCGGGWLRSHRLCYCIAGPR